MSPDDQRLAVAAACLVAMTLTLLALPPVLRRLPEPADGQGKRPYAALARPRFVLGTAWVVGVAVVVPGLTLGAASQPLWWVFAVGAGWLAAIDHRTTWLPWTLVLATAAGLAVAAAVAVAFTGDPWLAGRAAVGSALAGGLFWVIWRLLGRGFGFGDVQFAFLVGATTAADSWTLLSTSLIAGSLVGLVLAVVRLARRRSGAFAYLPALFAGPYAACLLSRLG